MNLRQLKKSTKQPSAGDVFVFQLNQMPDRFFWGRVIRIDAMFGPLKNMILVYLYKDSSNTKQPVPELRPTNLLLAPIATNTLPWSVGFFENVSSNTLRKEDILPQHCFRDSRSRFFDADGKPILNPVEPVGDYGLHSYQTIDDAISKALGIPVSSE